MGQRYSAGNDPILAGFSNLQTGLENYSRAGQQQAQLELQKQQEKRVADRFALESAPRSLKDLIAFAPDQATKDRYESIAREGVDNASRNPLSTGKPSYAENEAPGLSGVLAGAQPQDQSSLAPNYTVPAHRYEELRGLTENYIKNKQATAQLASTEALRKSEINKNEAIAGKTTAQATNLENGFTATGGPSAGSKDQQKSFNIVTAKLDSVRGDPAVKQAETDIYNAEKANALANLYGDPNKLSPQMTKLLVSEVGKIAQGGAPTMHELEGLTPNTLNTVLASGWSKLTNAPTPANAGAFVKQYQDYANTLEKGAQNTIMSKYGRVLNTHKDHLSEGDYKKLDDQYLGRFKPKEDTKAPAAQVSPEDQQALDYIKSNPTSRFADSIKAKLKGKGLM